MRRKLIRLPDGTIHLVPRSVVQDLRRHNQGRWFSGRPDMFTRDASAPAEAEVERDWAEDTELAR